MVHEVSVCLIFCINFQALLIPDDHGTCSQHRYIRQGTFQAGRPNVSIVGA